MPAELGKAKYIPIDKLEAGMKVHRDVPGRKDHVLINSGEILTKKHVQQMKKWEAREKPQGPALPKVDSKNRHERVRHGEFQGGWRPSHFNPHGILVSSTLASGLELPEVEKNPELSPAIQNRDITPRKSFAIAAEGADSPIQRGWKLKEEIKSLESTNALLGGQIHSTEEQFVGEPELEDRRDELKKDNDTIIQELKSGGNNGQLPKQSHGKRGRPKNKKS